MKRTQIYLETGQDKKLAARASALGVTKSEVIRRAIDAFLQPEAAEAARLRGFRAALAALEASPLSFPDGRTYVEELRKNDRRRQDEIERHRRR